MQATTLQITKLRKRRELLRRSVDEIASLAGIDRGELSRIERQRRPLLPGNAEKLARVYGVSSDLLIREAGQLVQVPALPAEVEAATHAS